MRYPYFASCFALTCGSAASFVDPCNFVGQRIAKCISSCMGDICTNFAVDPATGRIGRIEGSSDGLERVTCSRAKELRDEIYASVAENGRKRKRQSTVAALLNDIGSEINPALRALIYMDKPCAVTTAMARVDAEILRMSADSESWRPNLVLLLSSPQMTQLEELLKLLVRKTITSPASYDMATGITAPFLHFMTDLLSLLNPGVMDMSERALITLVVNRFSPSHREPYPGELPAPREMPSLEAARKIDNLANPEGNKNFADLMLLLFEYNRPSFAEASAAKQIVNEKLRAMVCSRLFKFSIATTPSSSVPGFMKTMMSAIDMCKDQPEVNDRVQASINVVFRDSTGQLPAKPDFEDASLPWITGFRPALNRKAGKHAETALLQFIAKRPVLKTVDGVKEFSTVSDFASRKEFERLMMALGRALGLTLRYNGHIMEVIDLRPSLFWEFVSKGDHAKIARDLNLSAAVRNNQARMEEALAQRVFEPLFFIRRGIEDVLGPAGLNSFSDLDWARMNKLGVQPNPFA